MLGLCYYACGEISEITPANRTSLYVNETLRRHVPCDFFKDFIYLFLEKEEEREKHKCVIASPAPPTGDLARNPGMCPDWESNWQPTLWFAGRHSIH